MSKLIASFAGLVGGLFHHLSGTSDASGFVHVGKLAYGADGAIPTDVTPATGLPIAGALGTLPQAGPGSIKGLVITGAVADGAAPQTYAHSVAGIDPTTGFKWTLATDAVGRQYAISSILAPQLAPTVTAAAYTTGQVIGGLMQFVAQPNSGYVTFGNITLASGGFTGTIDVLLFNANPSTSTVADRGLLVLAAVDIPKLIGVLHLTDLTAAGVAAIVAGSNLGQPYVLAGAGTTIFAVALVRGGVTLAATTDMTATLQVVR